MLGLTYLLLAGEEARRPPLQPPSSFCTLLLGWPFLRRNQPQAGRRGKMLVHQRMRWGGGAAPSPQPPSSFFTLLLGWPPLRRNQPQEPQPQPRQQQPSTHKNHNNNNNSKMLVHQRMRWGGGAAPSPTPLQLFYFTFRLASLQRTKSGYVRFDISSPCWGGGAAPSPPTSLQLLYFTFRLAFSAAEPTTSWGEGQNASPPANALGGRRCALPPTPLQLVYFTFKLASSATETTTTTTMCLLHHSMHHRDVSHNRFQHSWRG